MTNNQEPGNSSATEYAAIAGADFVLALAVAGLKADATSVLAGLCTLFPQHALTIVRVWGDSYIEHSTDGAQNCRAASMTFLNGMTGAVEVDKPRGMPDEMWWAARLLRAYVRRDYDGFIELWNGCAGMSAEDFGARVLNVLTCVATTMQQLPRGYATRKVAPWTSMN